jgi:hypothetical protein
LHFASLSAAFCRDNQSGRKMQMESQ